MTKQRLLQILEEILSLPTAPFHEGTVKDYISHFLSTRRIPHRSDSFGDIIVQYKKNPGSPPIGFIAHMDHPGFEIIQSKGNTATAKFLGRIDPSLARDRKIRIYPDSGIRAQVTRAIRQPKPQSSQLFSVKGNRPIPKGSYGMWDLPPFRFREDIVYGRAIDDLVGCAIILLLLDEIKRENLRRNVWVAFTRAEEVGLNGAIGLAMQRTIPRSVPLISVECSSILPGTDFGHGPVIRVGDAQSSFDPELLSFLYREARNLKKKRKSFQYQRHLMDGGTCEATPLCILGYATAGVAIPLGNYHNQGPRGIAPEYVHLRDVHHAVHFMFECVRHSSKIPYTNESLRKRLAQVSARSRRRLISSK